MAVFGNRVLTCLAQVVLSMSNAHRRYFYDKEDIDYPAYEMWPDAIRQFVEEKSRALNNADDERLVRLVEDLLRNRQYYRSGVAPRYHFDVPLDDLQRSLQLEGWQFTEEGLRRIEGVIVDLQAEEDTLLVLLRNSGLPDAAVAEMHLRRSAEDYGRDNNSSMTNSRQALEQVLRDIADLTASARGDGRPADENVRQYLFNSGFFTQEEWRGFNGVYGFLSAGAHPGITDQEAARLGRNFALGASHYALQKFQSWAQNGFRAF